MNVIGPFIIASPVSDALRPFSISPRFWARPIGCQCCQLLQLYSAHTAHILWQFSTSFFPLFGPLRDVGVAKVGSSASLGILVQDSGNRVSCLYNAQLVLQIYVTYRACPLSIPKVSLPSAYSFPPPPVSDVLNSIGDGTIMASVPLLSWTYADPSQQREKEGN